MLIRKAGNAGNLVRLAVSRAKPGVTFRTCCIRRCLEERCSLVLDVAGGACGSECLISVVQRRVVAREASFVGHMRRKFASLHDMAKPALLGEHRMST